MAAKSDEKVKGRPRPSSIYQELARDLVDDLTPEQMASMMLFGSRNGKGASLSAVVGQVIDYGDLAMVDALAVKLRAVRRLEEQPSPPAGWKPARSRGEGDEGDGEGEGQSEFWWWPVVGLTERLVARRYELEDEVLRGSGQELPVSALHAVGDGLREAV